MITTCTILAFVSAASLAYFYYANEGRKIERCYYRENKFLYSAMMFSTFVLIVALVMNSRHVAIQLGKKVLEIYFPWVLSIKLKIT